MDRSVSLLFVSLDRWKGTRRVGGKGARTLEFDVFAAFEGDEDGVFLRPLDFFEHPLHPQDRFPLAAGRFCLHPDFVSLLD